jgi:hypothetical protein
MAWLAGFWPRKSAQRCHFLRTVELRFARSSALWLVDETRADFYGSDAHQQTVEGFRGTSAAPAVRDLIEVVMTPRLLDLSEESGVDRNILNRASRRSNTEVVPFE